MIAFVLMGVSGAGKSTVGLHSAARLAWPFLEGDDFHPAENIEKMARGVALTDADRAPWIDALSIAINNKVAPFVIIACSALTRFVRHRLEEAVQRPITFIHLRASPQRLASRLHGRRHFMTADLLTSQLDALEAPSEAFEINADDGIDVVTARVIARMRTLVSNPRPHC